MDHHYYYYHMLFVDSQEVVVVEHMVHDALETFVYMNYQKLYRVVRYVVAVVVVVVEGEVVLLD
jgi:hypothetical protein